MKRIFAVTLLLLITLLCGACGEKADDTSADGTLKFGAWGESRELGFSEREDGSVWVVDENGNDVLDVTGYVKTEILGDEFTGETRLIKTYTPSGTAEVETEGESTVVINTYTYDYYDLNGKLLVEKSPYNLCSISGYWGLTLDWGNSGSNSLFFLKTGKLVAGSGGFEAYPTEAGVIVGDCSTEECIFYDEDGEKIKTMEQIYLYGYLPYFYRDFGIDGPWNSILSYDTVKSSYGIAEIFPGESEEQVVSGFEGAEAYDELIESVSAPPHRKDDLLIFKSFASGDGMGLIREDGEILLEPKYQGISYGGEDTVVAYGENQTEIYRISDFTLEKTLPYRMSLYDGENAAVQIAEYSFYLADAEGQQLSELYNDVIRIDMEENGVRFLCRIADSKDNVMLDRAGTVLYYLTNNPGVTYVGDGKLAIHSGSGLYITDTDGVILQVVRLWDGYVYDEVNNVILPAEEQ